MKRTVKILNNSTIITRTILILVGSASAALHWHRLISVYWQKDLPVPTNPWFLLFLAIIVGILSTMTLIYGVQKLLAGNRLAYLFESSLTLAFALPLVNFLVEWIFTELGIETSIYFISGDGRLLLVRDSLFLFVFGLITGTVFAAIISLLKVRTHMLK